MGPVSDAGTLDFSFTDPVRFVFTTMTSWPSGVLYAADARGPFNTSIDSMSLRGISLSVFLNQVGDADTTAPSTMIAGSFDDGAAGAIQPAVTAFKSTREV